MSGTIIAVSAVSLISYRIVREIILGCLKETALLEVKDSVRIAIADNGLGIPDEIKAKIFDPFFTTKAIGKGTGLGLAISYQIVVEVHQGKISIQTPPQGGVEFIIEFPISLSSDSNSLSQQIVLPEKTRCSRSL